MNKLVPLIVVLGVATACATDEPAVSGPTARPSSVPATEEPAGTPFSFQNISLVLPDALDTTADGSTVPRFDDANQDWFAVAPEHSKISLSYGADAAPEGSQIRVYPVDEMRRMDRAEDIDRLLAALADPSDHSSDALPHVPYFNAVPVIAARVEPVDFRSGHGIRFLTEYAQDTAPVSNGGLFYHFQGLTADEQYYVVAILPVGASILPVDSDPQAEVPAGGVAWPGYADADALNAYFPQVTEALDTAAADAFEPRLEVLDKLVESLEIS